MHVTSPSQLLCTGKMKYWSHCHHAALVRDGRGDQSATSQAPGRHLRSRGGWSIKCFERPHSASPHSPLPTSHPPTSPCPTPVSSGAWIFPPPQSPSAPSRRWPPTPNSPSAIHAELSIRPSRVGFVSPDVMGWAMLTLVLLHAISSSFSRTYSTSPTIASTLLSLLTGPCCEDERQWSPASGQTWTTLADLGASRTHSLLVDTEDPRIAFIKCEPAFAIDQTRECSRTK